MTEIKAAGVVVLATVMAAEGPAAAAAALEAKVDEVRQAVHLAPNRTLLLNSRN